METRDLSRHVAYESGRGAEGVARELDLDPDDLVALSSNENALGPSPLAVDAVRDAIDSVHCYPKASHVDLRERIGEKWDVDPMQIWLANGGDGALDYLSRAFLEPGDAVLVPRPGFAYYGMSARYHHGQVHTYSLRKGNGFAQTAEGILETYDGERIVHVTSPHNPTGSEMPPREVESLAAGTDADTLVVVDEAYGEFSDSPSAISLVTERDDVAVLRSFSKSYGLAGLRVGYAIVPKPWAPAYDRVNTPFAVSTVACKAGLAALDDEAHLRRTIETVRWARAYMTDHLEADTWDSAGNFVLAEVGNGSAVTQHARQQGVLIRDTTSFGLPECVRITCGTRDETRRAVDVINVAVTEADGQ